MRRKHSKLDQDNDDAMDEDGNDEYIDDDGVDDSWKWCMYCMSHAVMSGAVS